MAGLTMIAMKGSLAVPFITAFPILLLFCSRSIFETVLFLLCFTFTDCYEEAEGGCESVSSVGNNGCLSLQ